MGVGGGQGGLKLDETYNKKTINFAKGVEKAVPPANFVNKRESENALV